MSNSQVTEAILSDDKVTVAGIELHKITASSFTLCEFLKLGIVSGEAVRVPQFEILAFMWIHYVGPREARALAFSDSPKDEHGRSLALINAVLDWGETIKISDFAEVANAVMKMIEGAFADAVVPAENEQEMGN